MIWLALTVGVVVLWLASRQNPKYTKAYLQTRSNGPFRTSYSPGAEQYLEFVEEQVRLRMRVGPIAPLDDLHARLVHPELRENWEAALSGSRLYRAAMGVLDGSALVVAALSIAEVVTRLLSHQGGLLSPGHELAAEKLVSMVFAVATIVWLNRRTEARARTQGYLDGWSDRCKKTKL